jgi:hypothetical protein
MRKSRAWSRLVLAGLSIFGAGFSSTGADAFARSLTPGLIRTLCLLGADVLRGCLLLGLGLFALGLVRTWQFRRAWNRPKAAGPRPSP